MPFEGLNNLTIGQNSLPINEKVYPRPKSISHTPNFHNTIETIKKYRFQLSSTLVYSGIQGVLLKTHL